VAQCAICRRSCDAFETGRVSQGFACPACGRYEVGLLLATGVLSQLNPSDRRLAGLSAYVRESNKRGEAPVLRSENWEDLAAGYLHASAREKLRRVLERAEELTTRAGEAVKIYQALDYPLFHALESEVPFLVKTLIDQELLEQKSDAYVITAKGWEQLEPAGRGGAPGTCFVAMSFKPELDAAYDEGIRPAVTTDCGFDVIQLSRVEHSENINDKIIAEIRRAQFLVADFTFHPAGVYFEAGFGLGLGRLVIWTCRKDHFDERVHFDTRPYNHILWQHESELREKLRNRIRALVPNAKAA
jgi:hypothetical protein